MGKDKISKSGLFGVSHDLSTRLLKKKNLKVRDTKKEKKREVRDTHMRALTHTCRKTLSDEKMRK
jgi:hypothetical protein